MSKLNQNDFDKPGKVEINISVEVGNKNKTVKITMLFGVIAVIVLSLYEVVKVLN